MSLWKIFIAVAMGWIPSLGALEPTWEKLVDCRMVESPHNDGDSVEIEYGDQRQVIRFYFVDCIEKSPHSRERRIRQAEYFGIPKDSPEEEALQVAYAAAKFTATQLAQPFTVYTCWDKVDSTGKNSAVRAFVETSNGQDLGSLLISEGLAIIREGRAASDHPNGKNVSLQISALRSAETKARLEGKGAWGLGKKPDSLPSVVHEKNNFEATDRAGLFASAGRPVTVQGRVTSLAALPNDRITFVNFEGSKDGGFVGIIRADFLPLFHEHFADGLQAALVGQEVTLTGVITLYRDIPQIELHRPDQITLRGDKAKN